MVDVGADPIHAVAAQLTVAAPFACTVQTRIAALLADQGALGAHAAAGTVSVGAVGADPTVRADIIPAFSAMFTAFRADLRTIRAAFVADADGHAVAAVVAVVAPAIASRAVLAAVTITAHFLAAFLTLLAAGQTDIAAAGAGLSAVADELRAVFAHAATLTGRARAGGAHTALRAELVPAVAAVLGAVRADIGTLCTASLAETDGRTVSADIAVVAPAVTFHAGEAQAAELAKPFAAVLTAYPAALADLGAVFAACPAVSADVSRANTAQAVTAVVLFVAVASAFCRAVVAAFSAVADVIVRDEAAAELAGALHIPCMRREHQALVVVIESDRDQTEDQL